MSKLDWDKACHRNPDPTLAIRDRRDISLSKTPTARKEAEAKAKARRKAAVQAAKTRKLNRQRQQASELATLAQEEASSSAAAEFWDQLKKRMALANEKRRVRAVQSKKVMGSLGELLQQTLSSSKK